MNPVRWYGDALALVTVRRPNAAPSPASLPAATARPVRVVHVDTGGAPPVPGATTLRLPEDIGRPAAINRAVAALDVGVGWVALADPQVVWGTGALDELLAAAARHPRAALLGPAVGEGPVEWISTACVLLRRVAWDSVDGFDARHLDRGTDPEPADLDLCHRLGRAGWLCVGVPTAGVAVIATPATGMLEPHDRGLRRHVMPTRRD
jgi:N-acetylglucosaminyl-diphospho-decaprenol L-rhamnosyltransferase